MKKEGRKSLQGSLSEGNGSGEGKGNLILFFYLFSPLRNFFSLFALLCLLPLRTPSRATRDSKDAVEDHSGGGGLVMVAKRLLGTSRHIVIVTCERETARVCNVCVK